MTRTDPLWPLAAARDHRRPTGPLPPHRARPSRSVTPTTAASSRTPSEDPGTDQGIPRAQATMRSVTLVRSQDEPGFWESLGYHDYGDPWREQRYWGD